MIKFDIVTLFPHIFEEHFQNLPYKKAVQLKKAEYKIWNLRDYATDSYGTVDDKVYGGGKGMLLKIEPVFNALKDIYKKDPRKHTKKQKIILLSPKGEKYNQKKASMFSKMEQITLICGRYEGVDARITQNLATDVISIGDYVLSGGEIPALAVLESISRLLPGVLDKEAVREESFSGKYLEHPQYTRPENFKGMKVPQVLLSGNHKEIEKWKEKNKKKFIRQ